MTMLLLYAVVQPGALSLTEGLRAVDAGEVAVVVEHRADLPGLKQDELRAFGAALQDLSGQVALLPFRYRSVVKDESELDELVEEHHDEWVDRLAAVAGHVELIAHLGIDVSPGSEAGSGREYLMSRVAARRRTAEVTAELADSLGARAADVRALPSTSGMRVAVLVRREDAQAVKDSVLLWGAERELDVACTGPWPPFSFAEAGDGDDR